MKQGARQTQRDRQTTEQPVFLFSIPICIPTTMPLEKNAVVCARWYAPNPPRAPVTPFLLLAFAVQAPHPRHPSDASLQGLPRRQHHPADPTVQGVGQVQRGELDGEQDLRWTVNSKFLFAMRVVGVGCSFFWLPVSWHLCCRKILQ